MNELKLFLERMGALHDAVVLRLIWEPGSRILRFEIDDLCSNFAGLPEYPGAVPGSIALKEVIRVEFDIDMSEGQLNVYEIFVDAASEDEWRVKMLFWPSGRIVVSCRAAEFPDVNLFGME
ncbi:hypothetical protein AGMMS49960_14540 [Betaproteobacteria bacterium]|nr:hypothetical protein AGMMS49543_19430 [Betaproteobacteria bacterium]GHU02380.1 hypothetical protein AGMMS49960_14540 [Betaproteobacteria bacterium]GHU19917.1 hypothetical protein AGMMS50243_13110 [Betaproteobacteria bacterium]